MLVAGGGFDFPWCVAHLDLNWNLELQPLGLHVDACVALSLEPVWPRDKVLLVGEQHMVSNQQITECTKYIKILQKEEQFMLNKMHIAVFKTCFEISLSFGLFEFKVNLSKQEKTLSKDYKVV